MKTFCKPALWTITLALILVSALSALAQDRERRREGYDPADMLKRMDDNNNGVIEPNEVSGRSRMFIERAAERAKLDMKQPLPIDKLLPAMQQISEEFRKQQEGSKGPPSSASPSSSTKSGSSATTRPTGGFGSPPGTKAGAPVVSSGFGGQSSRAGAIMSLEAKFDQSVIDYVNGTMLKEQDKNGDGFIDNVEWKAGSWSTPPEESDLNKDNKLSREELCIRISKKRGIPIKGEPTSTVSSSPSSGSSSGSSPGTTDQNKKYADGLLQRYDKNKDGMLQRDEWKEMKTEHQGADANGDGTITLDELTTRVASYSSGGSGPSSGGPSGGGEKKPWKFGQDKVASTASAKKSYRFLTPTERLPKGMPDWFLKSDADGDGQIMMSEYTTSWTESTAADFAKYDLDGDGIITPGECLSVEKKK